MDPLASLFSDWRSEISQQLPFHSQLQRVWLRVHLKLSVRFPMFLCAQRLTDSEQVLQFQMLRAMQLAATWL